MSINHLALSETSTWLHVAYVVMAVLIGCIVALSGAYLIMRVLDCISLYRLHYAAITGANRIAEERAAEDRRAEEEIERMMAELDEVEPGYRPGDSPRWF